LLRASLLCTSFVGILFALLVPPLCGASAEPHQGEAPVQGINDPTPIAPQSYPPDQDQISQDAAQDAQSPQREGPALEGGVAIGNQALPHNLSPWGMFLAADIVVQAVMIGLVVASIITWTVWLSKSVELWFAKRRARRALALLEKEPSLAKAAVELGNARGIVPAFVTAAMTELRVSKDLSNKDGIKERIDSRLQGLQVAAARQVKSGTGLLATIGATAPFVGLFGTVWGIMNSFIGISEAQTTNLAVVAPGIAEALLATALGLAAAIPAVIIYNFFARSIGDYRALVADAAAEVMRQVSRDLDSGVLGRKRAIQQAAE
jgi:biopolymer transport protein ExbB